MIILFYLYFILFYIILYYLFIIEQLIFHRDYLKRQSVRVSSTDYHSAYKRCKNRVNKLIESTKKDYFKKRLTNSSNSKESWQAINELLNRKPKLNLLG